MTVQNYGRYAIILIVTVLLASYFSLGELTPAYANEINSANNFGIEGNYIEQNTKKLFGLIIVGLVVFGALKGWRRAIVLTCFLTFLGFASFELFAYGRLISAWLNSTDIKIIPIAAFFVGGILYISLLYKLYDLMCAFLKKHL